MSSGSHRPSVLRGPEIAGPTVRGRPLALVVAIALVLGALAGNAAWTFGWAAKCDKALHELLAEGKVGLWGEI